MRFIETLRMEMPPTISYASRDTSRLPRRQKRIGLASLFIGIFSAIITGILTLGLAASAMESHQAIVGMPKQVAAYKAQEAANAANDARYKKMQLAKWETHWAARAARGSLPALDDPQARRVVDAIERRFEKPLSDAQAHALIAALKKSDQTLIDPTIAIDSEPFPQHLSSAAHPLQKMPSAPASHPALPMQMLFGDFGPSRVLDLKIDRYYGADDVESGKIRLGPDGTLIPRPPSRGPSAPTTQEMRARLQAPYLSSAAFGFPPPNYASMLRAQRFEYALAASSAIANLIVALFLTITAVRTLRDRPHWGQWHRIYAGSQLVLAAAATYLWQRVFALPNNATSSGLLFMQIACAAAMIYPIALLSLLGHRGKAPHAGVADRFGS